MATTTPLTLPRTLFTPTLYTNILKLWFRDIPPTTRVVPPETTSRWFGKGAPEPNGKTFDEACTDEFEPVLEAIGPQQYTLPAAAVAADYRAEVASSAGIAAPFLADIQSADEAQTSANALGLMLLLDQMPRNIFRDNQAVVYGHYDRIARAVLRGVLEGRPRVDLHGSLRLVPCRRMWFYMPLMHSEYREDHDLYWKIMSEAQAELRADGDEESAGFVQYSLDFEKKHVGLIERFGRYPHRNVHLGREMTQEEKEYLEAGGENFGTGA
ncbi:DUF924-domain-containing protein [Pseudovirgaria hyperparasitica]|uniref:DUF924-domain-containing protein n=1 Tax=Pseudovirgaria hyperparasitica TaxID=470096 RepID=A0A6A6W776_9PEZI|nr:DUF924-domain-containing protein [Pseudovirgaria hyperparasitica]KAF2758483.1 DUF924-domain-containing protein [Pseudovirgaria hyperparasitica]